MTYIFDTPHRRINPLTGESVLVSPHRAKRPWQGQVEKTIQENLPKYDPDCYLCPGNERVNGEKNPQFDSTFVFNNDFSALLPDQTGEHAPEHPLLTSISERGICRVVCFSPRHDLTLPVMEIPDIEKVIRTWMQQTEELSEVAYIHYVQVFENKGALMGSSNPHPHSQIWATEHLPVEPGKELERQKAYYEENKRTLLFDYLEAERKYKERILFSNEHFTALVPFWAVWPFETMVIAHRNVQHLNELSEDEVSGLAEIMKKLTTRYDNLFNISFPYSMGFHQAPFDGRDHPEWTLHAHFYPPLLRSATVRKFMVGYEMLAMPQRDITPEIAAERLRSLSDTHYKNT